MILGILLWLFGFPEKSDKNYIALLIGLVLTIAMYFGAEQSFVLEVENPEEFQSLAYGIEVREATE